MAIPEEIYLGAIHIQDEDKITEDPINTTFNWNTLLVRIHKVAVSDAKVQVPIKPKKHGSNSRVKTEIVACEQSWHAREITQKFPELNS